MLSVHDIVVSLRQFPNSLNAAAISIHKSINNSLMTRNPGSGLMQTPDQVRWERDSLLLSVRSLQLNIEKQKRYNRRKQLLIKKQKAKIDSLKSMIEGFKNESFKAVMNMGLSNVEE